jgi:hypothetical protein
MWDVAPEIGDGLHTLVPPDTTWRIARVRLEFGPAPTIGALLASLSETMTFSRLLPYDLEFFEAPEGTYMYTYCEVPHLDAGIYDALSPLLPTRARRLT